LRFPDRPVRSRSPPSLTPPFVTPKSTKDRRAVIGLGIILRYLKQRIIIAGRRTRNGHVVDIDLAKFFDRVDHDGLMAQVAKRVTDKRVLRLIRSFLTAGALDDGV
jgi:hypothetical protein